MTTSYRIAVIPGDGIGLEVVPPAVRVLEEAAAAGGIAFEWIEFDWGCERYLRVGSLMPEDGLGQLARCDAIFLGAVGHPDVADHLSLWNLLIPIRRHFRQYINLRPIKLLPGLRSPLADRAERDIDFVIVRENNEGEYSQIGGRIYEGTVEEIAVQESVFTRRGVERVMDYALSLASNREGRLASATKSNGITVTMPFWDEVFRERVLAYPEVEVSQYHIDALSAQFVLDPGRFDVVVASNLFGDILSDLGAALAGSIGIAPSANLNPERAYPSMFEPIHGSAPDIAGKGIANPIGQIWSGAMMLDHLGHPELSARIMQEVARLLVEGEIRTRDLGGTARTEEVADAIVQGLGGLRRRGGRVE